MDETYIKVRGCWTYLYRAIGKFGKTLDFMLCGCFRFIKKITREVAHMIRKDQFASGENSPFRQFADLTA